MKKHTVFFAFLMVMMSCVILFGCNDKVRLKIEQREYTLAEGEKQAISVVLENYAKEVVFIYSSSDESIASVENGYIVAHKEGTADITVSTAVNGKEFSDIVKVNVDAVYRVEFKVDGQVVSGKDYKKTKR